ncbi:MAG: BadF/BadG/BcrA/BcrD ATPase family protein, partial [Slackia sp.]|nr:BadF/BadG/BcrA/BcrD ATPase family protein [Slackia sp.]
IALSEDGSAPRFAMNEGCAAGTGSFFEDQMERLGLRIEDYSRLVANARSVPRLSGRCSVFAKTDIIHRQQEGVPVEDILLGLCFATVKSYKATIVRRLPVKAPVALTGGTWRNAGVVRAVRESFELGDGELLVGEELEFAQAVGAALHARDGFAKHDDTDGTHDGTRDGTSRSALSATNGIDEDALERLAGLLEAKSLDDALPRCAPLVDHGYEPGEGYVCRPRPWRAGPDGRISCVIGVDAGSTSTNIAVADLEGRLLDAQYLRTRGDAFCAARDGLAALGKRLGDELDVRAVVTTGSGRSRLAELIGADLVRDEITAQARAAAEVDARTDTVFEIGGQDSKYVSMASGQVVEFQMNKICAAGTGSFVEEQAARLGIPLDEFGALALSSTAPVDLGERCTVFVETAIH